jgi:HEAT repeat protein
MTAALAGTDAALAALVGLLALSLTAVRVVIRLRGRRRRRLWPPASQAIARYVTTGGDPPRPAHRAERAMLLEVALQTLFDLGGSERDLLVELLEQLGYLDDAAAALTARRRAVRRRAAEMLAVTATPAVLPALLAGLDDPDALVRTSCARTLARVGAPDVLPRVAAAAERDIATAPGAASAVVLALGRRDPAALTPLLGADAPQPVKMVAVAVAGRLRLPDLAPALRACLHDGDQLATIAAQGLGLIGDIEAVGELRDLARDAHRAVRARAAAVTALGSIGDPWSVPLLEPLLRGADWPLRAAAAQALGQLGEPGAAALRRAVASGPAEAREHAEAALQW